MGAETHGRDIFKEAEYYCHIVLNNFPALVPKNYLYV